MSIKTAEELAGMRAAGLVVRRTLEAMKRAVRPGVTTVEVDEAGAEVIRAHGARPAPALVYGFPGVNLISVNNEVMHGIPGARKIRESDLVKLDVTVEKDGFMADAALTLGVGNISEQKSRLMACAERAFHCAMKVARAGVRVSEIGREIEREVRRTGFSVVRELGGHDSRTAKRSELFRWEFRRNIDRRHGNYRRADHCGWLWKSIFGCGRMDGGNSGWRDFRALRTYFGDYK
jgi:methionyl aminopeptidase